MMGGRRSEGVLEEDVDQGPLEDDVTRAGLGQWAPPRPWPTLAAQAALTLLGCASQPSAPGLRGEALFRLEVLVLHGNDDMQELLCNVGRHTATTVHCRAERNNRPQ